MSYGEQKVKLPPGATLIQEDEIKLPPGATLITDETVKKKPTTPDSNDGVKPSSPTPSNSTSQSVFGKFPTKDEYNATHPAQAVDEGGFQPTNLSSRKKRVMAVSDYLPAIKDMNQKAIADETFRQKPITDVDVKDKLQRAEQHKENVKQAIKNTTEKRLKIMGIDAPEGSPLYNEQKEKIEKAVLNGDATYHSKDGVPGLDRTVKWNEDLVNGWNEAIDANDEAATFANDMTTEQQVEFLNKKQTEQPPSEFYENRSGVGHLVGGAAPFLAKATAGAVVGGALAAAAPETGGLSLAGLPTAMSFIFTAPDAKNQGILREVSSRYQVIKNEHPEMSDVDAMEEAKKGGVLAGGVGGIVENALFMGAMDVPIPLQGKSVIGKFVKGTLKSGANMGAATAVANAGQLAERAAEGYKVTPEQVIDSSIETFKENATAGMLLHGVMQGIAGVGNIPKAVKSAFKFGLKDTPMESIVNTLDANVKAGNVSPEVATKTVEDIEGYRAALAKTAQGLTPETQASVAGLIQAKDNLVAEMATKDETQHAPYQEKIAALNEQIKKITETNDPLKYEVDDVTGKPLGEPATETPEVKGNPEEISQPIELSVEPKKEEVVPNEPLSDAPIEYEDLPQNVKDIVDKYGDANDKTDFHKKLEEAGYETEHDMESFGTESGVTFRKIKEPLSDVSNKPKTIIEPSKPISEMNSEELYNHAIETRKALNKQDKEFENKTEQEKQDAGYNDIVDNVEDLRDASQRVNFVENSENINELANSVKSVLNNFDKNNPSEYTLAVLNAAKKKAAELGIEPNDLIKKVIENVGKDFKDKEDAEFMMRNAMDKIIPKENEQTKAPEIPITSKGESPTTTTVDKVSGTAEEGTPTEEQVTKLITDAALNKKGERAKQLAMEQEAAKHGELGQKVLGDLNGGDNPPVEPKEVDNDGSEDWAAVRKAKLKEISGVKEMIEKRKPKGWTQTFQSAAENVQKMFPKKSLYEAMKSRVNQLKLKLDSGELYNPTSEDNAVFTMLRAETQKRISEVEGQDSANLIERQAANMELENLHNDLMDIARVTNPEGETGRAFNILQSEAKFDENNGLKIRRMELMKAKGGEPLTPEENKWAETQWEKEKEIMKQEQEAKAKGMQEDFDAKIAELQKEYEDKLKETGKGKSATTKDKTLSQKGKDIADQIRKLKIQKGDTAVDITMGLRNLAIEAVATLVEKGATIAEAIKKVLEDDKYKGLTEDELTNHIIDGLKNKKDKTEELNKIREFAKENEVTDITKDMVEKNLIRDYVNSHIGETEQADILNTAFKDLKEVLPSITKERMLEAYLKENEFKQPTKKALEGSIAEAKKELESIAKLEEDIKDLEGLKQLRQRSFQTERQKSEYEQKLYDEKNAKLKEISDRNKKIKEDNARIETERIRQQKKVEELTIKREKLLSGVKDAVEARDRKLDTPEIENLREQVKQIEKAIRAAEAEQKAAERKIERDRNKAIKEGNRIVESEAIRQVTKVQKLQAKKEALENGIREKRAVIKKVDTPEIERMKKAVKDADDNLRAAEVEARRIAKEIQDRKDKIGELEANIERAKNDRDLIKTHKDKSVREIDEEITNKQKELKKAIKDNSSDERVQAKKLEDAKKNVIKQKEEFQRKLDEGEFEEPEPVKLKKKDAELIRLEKEKSIIEEAYRKKQKEFQEKNKHWVERAMDTIRSSYVALLIGSPVTLAKVGFMSLARPLSEGVRKATLGKVFDAFFPNISKAALRGGESSSISSIKKGYEAYFRNIGEAKLEEKYQKAESELRQASKEYNDYKNSSNPDAKKLEQLKNKMNDKLIKSTGSFIYKFIGSSSIKDAMSALFNRSNEIEKQFGKVESESIKDGNWLDKANYLAGFIGRSHSAAKTFSGRFSFAAGFMARLEGAVKNGEDITKGDKILEIAHESYLDWERGKYQQSNAISDIWNKIVNSISKGEEKGIRTTTAKAMESLLKGDVAITRVPVNILHESVVEYTFGAIKAAYMGGKEYLKARKDVKESGIMPNEAEFKDALKQRISQMDEKQAATIVRCFTKGGIGIGLYALALISGGVHFGILPHLGQKKKKDEKDLKKGEMNPGDIIIGDTRLNHTFAKLVEHVPALYPAAMGLGMAQAYQDEIDKGKTTKEAVAKSIFTHLQIIEGSIPQTQILSPSRVSKKIYDITKKRLEEMGAISTDEKSMFTKDEQENTTIKTLKERGIELKQPSQSHHKIDVDEKHPNGLMMPDEWDKFQKIRKDVIMKGIPKSKDHDAVEGLDDIMKAHYKVMEKDKRGRVKSKIVQGKNLTDEQLKSKVQSLQEKATEYANDKLGLIKKKDTTTTIKKIR